MNAEFPWTLRLWILCMPSAQHLLVYHLGLCEHVVAHSYSASLLLRLADGCTMQLAHSSEAEVMHLQAAYDASAQSNLNPTIFAAWKVRPGLTEH